MPALVRAHVISLQPCAPPPPPRPYAKPLDLARREVGWSVTGVAGESAPAVGIGRLAEWVRKDLRLRWRARALMKGYHADRSTW